MGSFTLPSAMRDFSRERSFAAPAPRQAPITRMGQPPVQEGGRFDGNTMPGGWGNVGAGRPQRRQARRFRQRQRDQNRPQPADQGMPQSGGFLPGGNMAPLASKFKANLGQPGMQTGLWSGGGGFDPTSLNNPQTGLPAGVASPGNLAMVGGNMASAAGLPGPPTSAPPAQLPQAPGSNFAGGFTNPAQKLRRKFQAGQTGQGAGWGFLTNG